MTSAARRLGSLLLAIAALTVTLSGCFATTVLKASIVHVSDGRSYYLDGSLSKSTKHPLLIVLSGVNQTAASIAAQTGYGPFGKAHGVTVAFGISADNGWNAGGCCGIPQQKKVDDMAYLANVVQDVSKRVPIDERRVYLIGFSTGGMMAERAACERPDLFAAAGSMSGALLVPCPKGARIVHVHGLADPVVPVSGGYSIWVNFTFPKVSAEKAAVLTGHPDARYSVILLPRVGHGWPTLAKWGFNATSQIWNRISGYRLLPPSPTPTPTPTPTDSVTPTPEPTESPSETPAPTESASPSTDPTLAPTDAPSTDVPPTDVVPTDSPTGIQPTPDPSLVSAG